MNTCTAPTTDHIPRILHSAEVKVLICGQKIDANKSDPGKNTELSEEESRVLGQMCLHASSIVQKCCLTSAQSRR